MSSHMYADTVTWSPVQGCAFDCIYCTPSFKRQAKRRPCAACKRFVPHEHPERLSPRSIRRGNTVFVAGNSDISCAKPEYARRILDVVARHSAKHPNVSYYFQSKRPEYFEQFLTELPYSALLVTTLETNRDSTYDKISKAPPPTERHRQFLALDYPRKVVTVEPVMAFDLDRFAEMIAELNPEHVWVGFNSRPKSVSLPEPTTDEVALLIMRLRSMGMEVQGKDLRGARP